MSTSGIFFSTFNQGHRASKFARNIYATDGDEMLQNTPNANAMLYVVQINGLKELIQLQITVRR